VLTHLQIRNLAVVDAAELEIGPGLTVLTGETGAGKSILIDALGLVTGDRADSRAVRTGAERLDVSAGFDLSGRSDLRAWISAHDLPDGDECVLRRVVTAQGRSRGYVNGQSVPVQTLRVLGEQLIDICGQQAHQSLRHRGVQRAMLDGFGGHGKLAARMRDVHTRWLRARKRLEELRDSGDERRARHELLSYQVAELEALNLKPGEPGELDAELTRIANGGHIAEALDSGVRALYESDDVSAHGIVSGVRRQLTGLADIDPGLEPVAAMLGEAEILITEATDGLRRRADTLDHDPARQAELEERIASVQELARKHQVRPAELPALSIRLTGELDALDRGDQDLESLERDVAKLSAEMRDAAGELGAARARAAEDLSAQVSKNMQSLGMTGGLFEVALDPVGEEKISADGSEQVEFRVTTNPGQAPGELTRVASGGELSRISLALQVVAVAGSAIPTLIFDEVDAGVGGGIAEIVGHRLRELALQRQVLCVTHLPQVASQGNQHLRVSKIADGRSARTAVKGLTAAERIEEIARMLGGVEITSRTRAHAREMLKTAAERRAG